MRNMYFRVSKNTAEHILFAKIEIAGAVPQKISRLHVLVSYLSL